MGTPNKISIDCQYNLELERMEFILQGPHGAMESFWVPIDNSVAEMGLPYICKRFEKCVNELLSKEVVPVIRNVDHVMDKVQRIAFDHLSLAEGSLKPKLCEGYEQIVKEIEDYFDGLEQ